MKNAVIAILVLALLAVGAIVAWPKFFGKSPAPETGLPIKPSPSPEPSPRPCTMEAKLCPDGSAVGRIGPNCEFASCPAPKPTL